MMERASVPLIAAAICLATAGMAVAQPADGYRGWHRVLHDCDDDFGPNSAVPEGTGHDLVALDVSEREVPGPNGSIGLGLRITMERVVGQDPAANQGQPREQPQPDRPDQRNGTNGTAGPGNTGGGGGGGDTGGDTGGDGSAGDGQGGAGDNGTNGTNQTSTNESDTGPPNGTGGQDTNDTGPDQGTQDQQSQDQEPQDRQAEENDEEAAWEGPARLELSFSTSGGLLIATTLRTNDGRTFVHDGGDPPAQVSSPVNTTHHRFYLDVWYRYDQLNASEGAIVDTFYVQGGYQGEDADHMPGGSTDPDSGERSEDCPSQAGASTHYRSDGYRLTFPEPELPPVEAAVEPNFTWQPTTPRTLAPVQFLPNDTVLTNVTNVTWHWDLGDGNESTQRAPTHTYEREGTYNVTLNVSAELNETGEAIWNTTAREVELLEGNLPPTVHLRVAPLQPKVGQTVGFQDRSEDPDGEVVRWRWDFGDGNTSQQKATRHTYHQPGLYRVTLNVTDDGGKSASRTIEVYVTGNPDLQDDPATPGDDEGPVYENRTRIIRDNGSDGTSGATNESDDQPIEPTAGEPIPGPGLVAALVAMGAGAAMVSRRRR